MSDAWLCMQNTEFYDAKRKIQCDMKNIQNQGETWTPNRKQKAQAKYEQTGLLRKGRFLIFILNVFEILKIMFFYPSYEHTEFITF